MTRGGRESNLLPPKSDLQQSANNGGPVYPAGKTMGSRPRSKTNLPKAGAHTWARGVAPHPAVRRHVGGGGRESNPPGSFHRLNGFEDRGTHQAS